MKVMRHSKAGARWTCWLAMLAATAFLPTAESDDNHSAAATLEKRVTPAIRIVDQHGRQVPSGRRLGGSQIFDVTVGPANNPFQFVPNTVNISVGDTVRWTWGSDEHSVTSGDSTSCTADDQFCSPDNTNCDAGILSNTGFVYEHTFTQAGTYSYFCAFHCHIGMTGVVNVAASQRPTPTPRPRPTPHPRPVPPG
jgi:plastocyanin